MLCHTCPGARENGGRRVRCAECGAETGSAAQVCVVCGAPAAGRRSVAVGLAAGALGASREAVPVIDGASPAGARPGSTRFSTTRLRPGYDMEQVDAFLDAVRDTLLGVRQPPLTADEIRDKRFATTRLRPGYDEQEVDAFLGEAEARLRVRCAECGGQTTDTTAFCAVCEAPAVGQSPVAADPLAGGLGASAARRRRVRQVAWAGLPIVSFTLLAWWPFLVLALIRRRARDWVMFAASLAALAAEIAIITLASTPGATHGGRPGRRPAAPTFHDDPAPSGRRARLHPGGVPPRGRVALLVRRPASQGRRQAPAARLGSRRTARLAMRRRLGCLKRPRQAGSDDVTAVN